MNYKIYKDQKAIKINNNKKKASANQPRSADNTTVFYDTQQQQQFSLLRNSLPDPLTTQ